MAGVLSAAGLASPRKREYGHWSEVVSSAGKVYYYNRVTEQSQWIKPDGWEKAESVIFPVIDRLQQSRDESGFGENIQSDDDMDVSYGDSPIALSSSPDSSSFEGRPQSSKENREHDKIVEEEPEDPIMKYYRAELVASLHEKFDTERMKKAAAVRGSCSFEIQFAAQQTQMYRARALARTAFAKAQEYQLEVSTLSMIQQHLEDSRLFFQANFDSEMRRILRGPDRQMRKERRDLMEVDGDSTETDDTEQVSELSP